MRDWDRSAVVIALEAAIAKGVDAARSDFEGLRSSLEGESKSTAGDKHETGRAMVQMEMEQAALRLSRMEDMQRQWRNLDPGSPRRDVRGGAVVLTDRGGFVIGVAWGPFEGPGDLAWRAISADAPLAVAWAGRGPGDALTFRDQAWRIEDVT